MANQIQAIARGPAKLKAVTDLVNKLTADLESKSLATQEHITALEQLKIYGREPAHADPIFTKDGIHMLLRYAFDGPSSETSRAALRVLANSMLLVPGTRDMFVDQGFASKTCERLSTDNWDDEFLLTRILFYSTYSSNIDLTTLANDHHLGEHVIHNLKRHVQLLQDGLKAESNQMERMALDETLKILFNVSHLCPPAAPSFNPAVPHIIRLLLQLDSDPKAPLKPPSSLLINALINLDLKGEESQAALFPEDERTKVITHMSQMLDRSLTLYSGNDLDQTVAPLVTVIGSIYENAPDEMRQHMKEFLLPKSEDREMVLGRGSSLPSKVLKATGNPLAPHLRDGLLHVLFEMSDQDASKFVDNVGYGYAAGFLFSRNIPVPASASEASAAGASSGAQRLVNPVTGQFLDTEQHVDAPEMTQEEKEREAERLYVLFERLKRTGIIDVQNPVEQAFQEGRFEELDDDAEDD